MSPERLELVNNHNVSIQNKPFDFQIECSPPRVPIPLESLARLLPTPEVGHFSIVYPAGLLNVLGLFLLHLILSRI